MPRLLFILASVGAIVLITISGLIWSPAFFLLVPVLPLVGLGLIDMRQTRHSLRRNFPLIGRGRYLMESIRPEIQQYFVESDTDGKPFSREQRSIVYQRAKKDPDTLPFGTRHNVYAEGYEWLEHSIVPAKLLQTPPRVVIGGGQCEQPYSASLLNVSAMSFGSLSHAAIAALNGGAKDGGFAHNTGEGGISPYHLEPGGDLIWQIGTGYFGCRTASGEFNPETFSEQARLENVKMIELKLSQGAKPGHGGILPASKLTVEIAGIRHVPLGQDVLSPPSHSAFDNPIGLLEFVTKLRELSGGKPVGFKLCLGSRREFLGICKAMLETGLHPDFITVDGGEGGTGAAPLEFSNSVGTPLFDGLSFIQSALRGAGLRDRIRLAASGRIIDGFDLAVRLSLGADFCYSARGMLFSLGCIQALRCNNNACPTGIATQDPRLVKGLAVADKRGRVANFHRGTIFHLLELTAAAGRSSPAELGPELVRRRLSPTETRSLAELYPLLPVGALLEATVPPPFAADWSAARADRF